MRLLDLVRSLITPKPHAPSAAARVPTAERAPMARPMQGRATAVSAAQPTKMHAGKLQLIGLSAVRAKLGDRWEGVREKAMAIAAKAIRRRLTEVDVFAPVNGDAFVVLFIGLDEEHARFKALTIADEIKTLLCGELEGGFGLTVSSHVVGLRDAANQPDLESSDAFAAWVDRAIREADEATAADAGNAPPAQEKPVGPVDFDPVASVRVELVPTWNVRQKVITSYSCSLVRVDGDGRVVARKNIYPEGGQGSMTRDLDRVALEAAGRALRKLEHCASPTGIIVPLHFDTVSTVLHRNQFMDVVRNLPDNARNLLNVELCATPPGAPEGRLLEVLGVLKAFCRFIMMRVPFDPRAISMVPPGSVVAVSTIVDSDLTGEALMDRMSQFMERAKRVNLNAVLVEETDPDTAATAVRCGFTHVSGDVVGPPVAQPAGVQSLAPPPFMKIVDVLNTAAHQECA
ncbi:MAG: hypothetical protein P4L90_29360 [Rhodopila sp.]|nr:hypothetical protein [Rhodopila sp.]